MAINLLFRCILDELTTMSNGVKVAGLAIKLKRPFTFSQSLILFPLTEGCNNKRLLSI